MKCFKCDSDRVLQLTAKCSDLCFTTFNSIDKDGYVPEIRHVGGGDYVETRICLECGQVQGKFPVRYTRSNR